MCVCARACMREFARECACRRARIYVLYVRVLMRMYLRNCVCVRLCFCLYVNMIIKSP